MIVRSVCLLLVGVLLSGCLPGDRRTQPRELFPADSLSRQIAEAAPVDTMALVWRVDLPTEARYPLTLTWTADRIVVADLQRGYLFMLAEDGRTLGSASFPQIEYPLLIGAIGDTVAVLSRGTSEVHLVRLDVAAEATLIGTIPIPEGRNAVGAWAGQDLFVKLADQDEGSAIFRLDDRGRILAEYPLREPFWRHIGFLRMHEGRLVSLGGYRPVVETVSTDAPSGTSPDSLLLMGFDSPQLERSRLFSLGEIREPPLLVPSAATAGDRLAVLNARPGWAHIDLFARTRGELRLERSLLSPGADLGRNYFAPDLAVRVTDGGLDLLVLEARPRPAVVRYRWKSAED